MLNVVRVCTSAIWKVSASVDGSLRVWNIESGMCDVTILHSEAIMWPVSETAS